MQHAVRIIGGLYRGKKLQFPTALGLRPTPNRVRETVFNWLMHSIRGAHCLDAFAGSGALGFEAFSRGAASVTLVEKAPAVYQHLTHQAQAFKTNQIQVIQQDAHRFINETSAQFNLIFLDPPFEYWSAFPHQTLKRLAAITVPQGLIYLESPAPIILDTQQWTCIKAKHTGQVHYALFKKITDSTEPCS